VGKAFKSSRRAARLASSGDSDDGGLVPPPRKKRHLDTEETMLQPTNGCLQHNGSVEQPSSSSTVNGGSSASDNGDGPEQSNGCNIKGRSSQEIVRLIGQHLKLIGLK